MILRNSHALNRLEGLFRGADQGAYVLPSDLTRLRAAVETLAAPVEAEHPGQVEARLAAVMADAAVAGEDPRDVLELLDAHQAVEVVRLANRVRQRAAELTVDRLRDAVESAAEILIVECLRPALDAVLDDAGKVADTVGASTAWPETLTIPAGSSRRELEPLSERYAAIRGARRALTQVGIRPSADIEYAIFGEFMNLPDVWPNFRTRRNPPWPPDPVGRLLWLAVGPAMPWLPTPAEQDQAYLRYVRELAATPGSHVGPAVVQRVEAAVAG